MNAAGAPSAPDPALASFLDKWRGRWPEWPIAEVFVPPPHRQAALAWATLLQELTDAAWGGRDARPGEAKLAWWQEELQGWSAGMRRHPLALALQRLPAPWAALAQAVPALAESRTRAHDASQALALVQPFAEAAAQAEAALFDMRPAPEALALSLLYLRLAHHPDDAVPVRWSLDHGDGARASWARELHDRLRAQRAARPRGIWLRLSQARLRQPDPAQPLSPPRALWSAWRGAIARG